jgi:hypothetical protein
MNERRVRELTVQYAAGLVEILRTISEAGEPTEEHATAIRHVEKALLRCMEFPVPPTDSRVDIDHFGE